MNGKIVSGGGTEQRDIRESRTPAIHHLTDQQSIYRPISHSTGLFITPNIRRFLRSPLLSFHFLESATNLNVIEGNVMRSPSAHIADPRRRGGDLQQ